MQLDVLAARLAGTGRFDQADKELEYLLRVRRLDARLGLGLARALAFQNDPADLPLLLAHCSDVDVVNGVRTDRADGLVRRLSSRLANAVRNRLTGESVSDVGCSLRVMRASKLREVKLYDGLHRFLPTLLRLEGARVIEVPVSHRPRRFGSSKYGVSNRLFAAIADLYAVRWMQRRHLKRAANRSAVGTGHSGDGR